MAKHVSNLEDLKVYFNGVMERADHHANEVNEIILALVGCVMWKLDGNLRIREYDGAPANMLWMDIKDTRYCFNYNHLEGYIEIRKESAKGVVLKTFTNTTTLGELKSFFENL